MGHSRCDKSVFLEDVTVIGYAGARVVLRQRSMAARRPLTIDGPRRELLMNTYDQIYEERLSAKCVDNLDVAQ